MNCHNCLKPLQFKSGNFLTSNGNYRCQNPSCNLWCYVSIDRGHFYAFSILYNNQFYELNFDQKNNFIRLFTRSNGLLATRTLLVQCPFIPIDLNNLSQEVPKILNKLLTLQAFS